MPSLADNAWIRVKSVYLRVTLSRFTLIFFLFSFAHCFAQGIIQSFLYTVDASASSLVTSILTEAQVPVTHEFAWLQRSYATDANGTRTTDFWLQLCEHIPRGQTPSPCVTIFQSGRDPGALPAGMRRRDGGAASVPLSSADMSVTTSYGSDGAVDGVNLLPKGASEPVFLNNQCTRVLVYPDQVLSNAKREDLALIGSQFWLFIISVYGIVYESIPHILAALCTRVLATGWSAYAIWRTQDINVRFSALVTDPSSPCAANIFPTYLRDRTVFEIPDLVLNCTALLLCAYISWRLTKMYMAQTFQYICPTKDILRSYRFFMAVAVCLQLSGFFLVTAMGLWVDQLINSALSHISSHTAIYEAEFIFTSLILVPWIVLGWYAITREQRRATHVFLALAFLLIASWSIMFYSLVYRWTFVQWPFFGCMTVASFVVILLASAWTAVCQARFGRGLGQHLYVSNKLAAADFEPDLFPHDPLQKGDLEKAPPDEFVEIEIELPPAAYLPTLKYGRS